MGSAYWSLEDCCWKDHEPAVARPAAVPAPAPPVEAELPEAATAEVQ